MEDSQKFRSIVSTILDVPEGQVTDDLSPETVDTWDSLNHINLISALEQEFGVTLSADSLPDSMSIPHLKALLAQHGVEV
ncbi:MAG: acyl carrier protein [Phycisphaerae bacterium]|nr:acyl carrier protein [Phycisphaerae bacterium]